MDLLLAPRVPQGSSVAVVSPCGRRVFWVPHRAEQGRVYLESLDLNVKIMPHAGEAMAGEEVSPEERAEDLHMAFADPEVSVVLAAIGGDHSADLLPHIDYDLIRRHPKIFEGYSDVTVLHWALLKFAGLCTFHGPALLPELGEFPSVLPYTDRYLRAAWFGAEPLRPEPAEEWTDEMLDWFQGLDQIRPRQLIRSEGWVTVREGLAEGPLIGGCLETISRHLAGSGAWLPLENALLFLETSEDVPSPEQVDESLEPVARLGTFEQVSGLIVGRPYGYDVEREQALWEVIERRTSRSGLPVLANVDLGHTDPMLTLPMGAHTALDATRQTLTVTQVATSPSPSAAS